MGSADYDRGDLDTLHERVRRLVGERRYEAAAACCEVLIERYEQYDEWYVEARVADAMAQECWSLRKCGDGERLMAAVARLNERFGDESEPWLSRCAARGPLEAVCWFLRSGQPGAAIAASETLIERFEHASGREVRDGLGETLLSTASHLAWAAPQPLTYAGLFLSPLTDAAGSSYTWITTRIPAGRTRLRLGRLPTLASGGAGDSEIRRRRVEQALRIYDLLIAHYDRSQELSLHRLAVAAKLNRAPLLVLLGRARSAWSACWEVAHLDPDELAAIATTAKANADGEFTKTAMIAAAMLTVVSPPGRQSNVGGRSAQTILDSVKVSRSVSGWILARIVKILGRLGFPESA